MLPLLLLIGCFAWAGAADSGTDSSPSLADAVVNARTVLENHILKNGQGGTIRLGRRRLSLEGVQEETVHRTLDGRFSLLASFRDLDARVTRIADCLLDMRANDWRVERIRIVPGAEAAQLRKRFAATSILQRKEEMQTKDSPPEARPAAQKRRKMAGNELTNVPLDELDGESRAAVQACSTKRCLVVFVAPWCRYCRASTAQIVELEEYLREKGVDTQVVVSSAERGSCVAYAREFGPETLLDPDKRIAIDSFPAFIVTDDAGRVLGRSAGAPPHDDPESNAQALGL